MTLGIDNLENQSIPISSGNTLYVGGTGPGNYTKIQEAIDNATDGNTVFVFNGTYHVRVTESRGLVVDKSINLIGEDRNNTIINGSGCEDIIRVTANNTNISSFTVRDGRYGIYGWYINNVTISMMNFIQTTYGGIRLIQYNWVSSFHTINTCVFKENVVAISISGAKNIISGNIFENQIFGIDMLGDYNKIIGNKFINYDINYFLHLKIVYSIGSIICENTFINSQGNDSMAIYLDHGNRENIISNNSISGYDNGIFMDWDNKFNMIVNNNISDNIWGILIRNRKYNKVISNNFINNTHHAYFRNTIFTKWDANYWGVSRILPKIIFGDFKIGAFIIPWFNVDWHPAKEPYDIEV